MDRKEEGWRGTERYGKGLKGVEWDGEGWRGMERYGEVWREWKGIEIVTKALSYLI